MMSRSDYRSRPQSASDQLVDLHVYVVPLEIWRERFNNLLNQAVDETVSIGIIRVTPDLKLINLRDEIVQQLEDMVPREYVFLKSVGRSLTRLKTRQEYQLKVKHFLPPVACAPELFLLEANADLRASVASDGGNSRSQSSFRQIGDSPRSRNRGYNSYRDDHDTGSKTYRDGYGSDERYGQTNDKRRLYGEADLQTAKNSRMQRSGDRVSPSRRYTPLPKIDPSSPSGSRDPSPEYGRNDGRESDHINLMSDSQESYDMYNHSHPTGNQNSHDTKYTHNKYDYRNKPQQSPQRHERAYSEKSPNDAYSSNTRSPSRDKPADGYSVLPPINDTPPRSAESNHGTKSQNKDRYDPRSATYTTNTNEDSGIAELTPEDHYQSRDRDNYHNALDRNRRNLQNRLNRDKANIDQDDDILNQYRFEDMEDRDQIDKERWEKDQDYKRRWIEEERRRREDEEEKNKREAEAEDAENRKKLERRDSDEDLERYPSPPELHMQSPSPRDRETESAKQRRREEREKLLKELESHKEGRKNTEREREELVKRAKHLQNRTQNKRNHARDIWKKRYFEEKKKSAPLEEQTNRLRHELDSIHRKLMSTLEGPREKNLRFSDTKPSIKNNYVIQCTRLQHEIEDLRRRVENAKMKLTAEMKLRNQAEAELRALRAELTQKKINLTLTRNQQLAALNPAGEVPVTQVTAVASL